MLRETRAPACKQYLIHLTFVLKAIMYRPISYNIESLLPDHVL